jgi:hypothetical protein
MTVKLLAFAGSTRNGSLNQVLLDLAVKEARDRGAEVTAIRLKDFALPLYDGDMEVEAFPQGARDLKALFRSHHRFLVATERVTTSRSPCQRAAWSKILSRVSDQPCISACIGGSLLRRHRSGQPCIWMRY